LGHHIGPFLDADRDVQELLADFVAMALYQLLDAEDLIPQGLRRLDYDKVSVGISGHGYDKYPIYKGRIMFVNANIIPREWIYARKRPNQDFNFIALMKSAFEIASNDRKISLVDFISKLKKRSGKFHIDVGHTDKSIHSEVEESPKPDTTKVISSPTAAAPSRAMASSFVKSLEETINRFLKGRYLAQVELTFDDKLEIPGDFQPILPFFIGSDGMRRLRFLIGLNVNRRALAESIGSSLNLDVIHQRDFNNLLGVNAAMIGDLDKQLAKMAGVSRARIGELLGQNIDREMFEFALYQQAYLLGINRNDTKKIMQKVYEILGPNGSPINTLKLRQKMIEGFKELNLEETEFGKFIFLNQSTIPVEEVLSGLIEAHLIQTLHWPVLIKQLAEGKGVTEEKIYKSLSNPRYAIVLQYIVDYYQRNRLVLPKGLELVDHEEDTMLESANRYLDKKFWKNLVSQERYSGINFDQILEIFLLESKERIESISRAVASYSKKDVRRENNRRKKDKRPEIIWNKEVAFESSLIEAVFILRQNFENMLRDEMDKKFPSNDIENELKRIGDGLFPITKISGMDVYYRRKATVVLEKGQTLRIRDLLRKDELLSIQCDAQGEFNFQGIPYVADGKTYIYNPYREMVEISRKGNRFTIKNLGLPALEVDRAMTVTKLNKENELPSVDVRSTDQIGPIELRLLQAKEGQKKYYIAVYKNIAIEYRLGLVFKRLIPFKRVHYYITPKPQWKLVGAVYFDEEGIDYNRAFKIFSGYKNKERTPPASISVEENSLDYSLTLKYRILEVIVEIETSMRKQRILEDYTITPQQLLEGFIPDGTTVRVVYKETEGAGEDTLSTWGVLQRVMHKQRKVVIKIGGKDTEFSIDNNSEGPQLSKVEHMFYSKKWQQNIDRDLFGSPSIGALIIPEGILVRGYDSGTMMLLDRQTGQEKWRKSFVGEGGKIRDWVVIPEGIVVGMKAGRVMLLDNKSGDVKWQKESGKFIERIASSTEGIVVGGLNEVVLLDRQTGQEKWSKDFDEDLVKTIAVTPQGIVVGGSNMGKVVLLDRQTGQEKWQQYLGETREKHIAATDDVFSIPPTPVESITATSEGIVVNIDEGRVVLLDNKSGKVKWEKKIGECVRDIHTTPKGIRVISSFGDEWMQTRMVLLNNQTGQEEWATTIEDADVANVRLSSKENELVIETNDERVGLFNSQTGKIRWQKIHDGHITEVYPQGLVVGSEDKMFRVVEFWQPVSDLAMIKVEEKRKRVDVSNPGGINMGYADFNLLIKRDGQGVPLPLSSQDKAMLSAPGFVPIIQEITPAVVPLLSELKELASKQKG